MGHDGNEPDYLARTQLKSDPDSFEACVREAFLLEHACNTLEDIGVVVGVDKTQVHHYFSRPDTMQPKTIRNILAPLRSHKHRRRIVRAWILLGTGVDIAKRVRGQLTSGEVSEATIKRIDKQVSQGRLEAAAFLSFEAAEAATDVSLRERFLDRSYYARLRLNLPGRAMGIVHMIAKGAIERNEPWRLAVAYTRLARVLTVMLDSKPEEVGAALDRADQLLVSPEPDPKPQYNVASYELVEDLRNASYLTFAERGHEAVDERRLRSMLKDYTSSEGGNKRRGMDPYSGHMMAARILDLLGEKFAALEHVDKAFAAGKGKVHNCRELCGHEQTRILRGTEPRDVVIKRFWAMTDNYSRALNLQHRMVAEYDLAREYGAQLLEI
ncbi:MAG: hypothetical protein JSS66_08455 [Armatimonadetes bacterium]|nr:hypothetical protein [Armatimonadota bacterium]